MEHGGAVVWLTGLSGSGKTTLAAALAERLRARALRVEVLDGDEVRAALSPDLGFSPQDREVHNRRVIYVAGLLSRHGVIVLVPLISPLRTVRAEARRALHPFLEVYVKASLETCMARDPKGLYRRALAGEVREMTGLAQPYEEPLAPDLVVETEHLSVAEGVERILERLWPLVGLTVASPRREVR